MTGRWAPWVPAARHAPRPGCISVPCPRFDGGWSGDPLGVPGEPNPVFLDTGWTEGVTRAWREHPILREES